jgi:uncharacterized iron-regulated membrane protein
MRWNLLVRKTHSWGAILVALPVIVIIGTGLLLQLKKQIAWVQPAEFEGTGTTPAVSLDQVMRAASTVPSAEVRGWEDVRRIDVRPGKGVAKVWTRNGWEVQVDLGTSRVLHSAYRRSDLIESLHDGSWFHEHAKLWVFFPAGLTLLVLWLTGMYLFALPVWVRRRRPPRVQSAKVRSGS